MMKYSVTVHLMLLVLENVATIFMMLESFVVTMFIESIYYKAVFTLNNLDLTPLLITSPCLYMKTSNTTTDSNTMSSHEGNTTDPIERSSHVY